MVHLDYGLIHEARNFITGANVHQVKEMIFVYQQAVDLHNRRWPSHAIYQDSYERKLRVFVTRERMRTSQPIGRGM